MSAPRVEMHRLQELVRLYRMGTGVRERARLLTMSTTTERTYRRAVAAAGLLEGDPGDLPELSLLSAAVAMALPPPPPRPVESSADAWMPVIREGVERGIGPQAIWDRLRRVDPEFAASVWAVRRAARRVAREAGVRAEDVVLRVETRPGEVAQVDFGFAGRLFDPGTGKVRKAWVFVMVLCYSRHMYARLVWDQRASTWVRLHVDAFRWFGGVPGTVVPDNLKAAVVRTAFGVVDRDQLALNRTYRELARHYGFKVDPTPPRQPEKKGKVESAVKYVKRNFLAAGAFETLDEANADLPDWLTRTAGSRIHGTTGVRPLDAFALERPTLTALPALPYETVIWKHGTVHTDSHVEFDRRLYSVPWRNIGRKVWIRATDASVYVYHDEERVATHSRRWTGRNSTDESHLPEHRRDLVHRSVEYWLERADLMGEVVGAYIRAVMDSDAVLSRLRDVQAMVTYLEQFPPARAAGACRRAHRYGNYSYQGLKRILIRGLDLEPLPGANSGHGRITEPRFARPVPTTNNGGN